ncbi:MAG: hypothetical protein AAFP19_22340, partial [Bacteroidota bacterium]
HKLLSHWGKCFFKSIKTVTQMAYGLLWYKKFNDHDYYVIDLLVYPLAIWVTVLMDLKKHFPQWLSSLWLKGLFVLFLGINIYHAKGILNYRYDPNGVHMSYFNPAYYKTKELRAFLRSKGIQYPDKVVSVPDQSPNNTLYHLNLKGWTELYIGGTIPTDQVQRYVDQGAQYLIVGDTSYLRKPWLQPFYRKEVGNFEKAIYVFDIRGMGTAADLSQ